MPSSYSVCAVKGCTTSRQSIPAIRLFSFTSKTRQSWLKICGIKSATTRLAICEKHFEKKYISFHRLVADAIPTLNLNLTAEISVENAKENPTKSTADKISELKKQNDEAYSETATSDDDILMTEDLNCNNCQLRKKQNEYSETLVEFWKSEFKDLEKYYEQLKEIHKLLENSCDILQKKPFNYSHNSNDEQSIILLTQTPNNSKVTSTESLTEKDEKCAIEACHSMRSQPNIRMFQFSQEYRSNWIAICGITNAKPKMFICQKHFETKFLKCPRGLPDDAIPTLSLCATITNSNEKSTNVPINNDNEKSERENVTVLKKTHNLEVETTDVANLATDSKNEAKPCSECKKQVKDILENTRSSCQYKTKFEELFEKYEKLQTDHINLRKFWRTLEEEISSTHTVKKSVRNTKTKYVM